MVEAVAKMRGQAVDYIIAGLVTVLFVNQILDAILAHYVTTVEFYTLIGGAFTACIGYKATAGRNGRNGHDNGKGREK